METAGRAALRLLGSQLTVFHKVLSILSNCDILCSNALTDVTVL